MPQTNCHPACLPGGKCAAPRLPFRSSCLTQHGIALACATAAGTKTGCQVRPMHGCVSHADGLDSALTCPRAPTLQVCPALLWKGLSSGAGIPTLQQRSQRALARLGTARCVTTSRQVPLALSAEGENLPQLFISLPLLCAFSAGR